MEWDSRLVSTIHATIVSVLCIAALVVDRNIWSYPLTYPSHTGLLALSISIGYFLCDLVSMPMYWRGPALIIFNIHHLAAVIAFHQLIHYRIAIFFGVYRLTTELSTPFTNQRWFYRTIGYTPDRRRVNIVTLLFAILFAVTRNLMILPFWVIAYSAYNSPTYSSCKTFIPHLDLAFTVPPLILDCLNMYWATKTYRIGWRSAKSLWNSDWRSDINRARARLRRRFRRFQGRPSLESSSVPIVLPTTIPTPIAVSSTEEINFILESSSSSDVEESEWEQFDNVEPNESAVTEHQTNHQETDSPDTVISQRHISLQ